jgi:fatty acid desaturase
LATVAFAEWVRNNAGGGAFLAVYPLAIMVIGARQRGLATLLHDAAHRTLAGNKVVNLLAGTLFAGYPVLQSYSGYRATHVRAHHPLQTFGVLGADPDYTEIVNLGLYGQGSDSPRARRYLFGLVGPVPTFKYAAYLLRHRMLAPQESRRERMVRVVYLAFVVTMATYFGFGWLLVLYWFVPLVTSANWIGSLSELVEHYPFMETEPRIDIFLSRNTLGNAFANFFLGVHNDSYHRVHHLFPSISGWNFRRAHVVLMRDAVYSELHSSAGWRDVLRELVRVRDLEAAG